jgi:hypothetical protein
VTLGWRRGSQRTPGSRVEEDKVRRLGSGRQCFLEFAKDHSYVLLFVCLYGTEKSYTSIPRFFFIFNLF